MKAVFGWVFVGLLGLSAIAWRLPEQEVPEGKTPIVWVSDDNPTRREQMDLFNRLHPEYELMLDPTNSGMQKVIVQCIGGVGPDLFDCYDGFQLSAYVTSGIAWDVTDELLRQGVDVIETVWPSVYPNCVHEGRVYGHPTNAAVDAIWFNKAIFDTEGVPYPSDPDWSWDEFIALAKRLTKFDANGRPVHFGFLCDWYQWKTFVRAWGGSIFSEDGTQCVIDSPEAIAGVQFLHDLIYVHQVMPSPAQEAGMAAAGGWGSGAITWFGGARGAMALGGRWWLNRFRIDYTNVPLGAIMRPAGPAGIYRGYGRATLINANSPRREDALKFLIYMNGQAYNELINHQADAVSPVKRWCYTDLFLHDPDFPQEDYNATWLEAMERGLPDEVSPFVNGNVADRILTKQLDLVKADEKPAADALRTAAAEINREIEKSLERDPTLRMRYDRLRRTERP